MWCCFWRQTSRHARKVRQTHLSATRSLCVHVVSCLANGGGREKKVQYVCGLPYAFFFCACSKDSFFPPSPRINGETSRTYACVQKRKDVPLLPFYFCFAESHICLPRNQCYASRSNQHLSVRIIHVVFLTLILMLSSLFFFLSPFPPFFFNLNHFLHNYVHPVVAIRKRKLSPCFFFFVREVTLSRDAHIHVYARHHQSSFLPLPLHFQT